MTNNLKLYDAEGTRRVDERARAQLGLSGIELMSRAARAALEATLERYPHARALSIWTGKGNNAGDGWLLGAQAAQLGLSVQLVGLVPAEQVSGDAKIALEQAQEAGLELIPYTEDIEILGDVIVDGMLGTGFTGALKSPFAQAIEKINTTDKPIVAIDIPSGVSASTGGVAQTAVNAAMTVTFITEKIGLHTGAGPAFAGEILFRDLGVDSNVYLESRAMALFARPQLLDQVVRQSYKHMRGHVAVVGGDHGMAGAVVLASSAAMRAGAGLVTAVTQTEHCPIIVGRMPEVMAVSADDSGLDKIDQADTVVLGPGLGRGQWGHKIFKRVEASLKPTVLDADGLYHLAAQGGWAGGPLFLTPHVGEAATLLASAAADIEQDRVASAEAISQKYGATVVLKGPGSVVTGPGLNGVAICQHGNPGMASAGMGDVLAGIAGGLLSHCFRQQANSERVDEVFAQAVALHSASADLAASEVGQRSLIASDVIDALPKLLK